MGCVLSVGRNEPPSTRMSAVFSVVNIDEDGKSKRNCEIEVVDSNLVLRTKQSDKSFVWPLNTVRRYGYEESMFCFESGRYSPTGEGIFAFKTKDAKQIFNAVQEKIAADNSLSLPLVEDAVVLNRTSGASDSNLFDYTFCGPLELPDEQSVIYVDVEASPSSSKTKTEVMPTPEKTIKNYTAIDYDQTLRISQKMFKCHDTGDLSVRKTRHDSAP